MTKYKAKPTVVDNIRFASRREAQRYQELRLLDTAGHIKNLELQPSFQLIVNESKICTYRADFMYFDMRKGTTVVEDCKGFRTPVYRIKKALFRALYGREIFET